MEVLTALGFDGMLLAHASASLVLFGLIYRFCKTADPIHPKLEKLLASLITAVLNVLIEIARGDDARIDFAMFSSVIVGAFVALLITDAITKKKATQ